jgi:hypothetical protein
MLAMSTPTPWTIYKGNQLVHSHISIMILGSIAPGQSKTWIWDMKNMSGKLVPAGSYTIKVGQLWLGDAQFTRSVTVALTPSGKLAGSSFFPLAVGNEWNYSTFPSIGSPGGLFEKMKVTTKSGIWHKVTNLLGNDRWAKLSGGLYPTLSIWGPGDLFRFNRPVGYTYTVNNQWFTKLKVGAKNVTVMTPAGTFKDCYRIDVAASAMADAGYGSFWFAPGVGLVQYETIWIGGSKLYKLDSAKIRGSDNKLYVIGQ